jgi:mutator protein MutT
MNNIDKTHPFASFHYCPKCGSSHFVIHNFKSKECLDCGFVYYFNPCSATVAFIVNDKKELLVCRRAHNPAKGTLDLPGGFVDMEETGEEGVIREVMEETCLQVKKATYLFSLPNKYVYSKFEVQTLDMFFRCEIENWTEPSAHDDVSQLQFVPLTQIDVERFGLASVKIGLKRFLEMNIG